MVIIVAIIIIIIKQAFAFNKAWVETK